MKAARVHRRSARAGLLLCAFGAAACAAPPRPAQTPAAGEPAAGGAEPEEALALELPARRSAAPRAAILPELPPALEAPPEVTLELEISAPRPGGTVTRRQDVARSADRIDIRLPDEGIEWLFIRNPLDRRRVSARLVDHRQRAIIEYEESELRSSGIARGWADVACFGIGADTLAKLQPTGRSERQFDLTFVELGANPGAASAPIPDQVWWSQEAALPLRISRSTPPLEITLRLLARGVDRERLQEPSTRYRGYGVMDIADYREKHHQDAPAPGAVQQHSH